MKPPRSCVWVLTGVVSWAGTASLAHEPDVRRAVGGTTTISLLEPLMNRIGLDLVDVETSAAARGAFERSVSFAVSPESTLEFAIDHGRVEALHGGSLIHRGGMVFRCGKDEICLSDFSFDLTGADAELTEADGGSSGRTVFRLPDARELFQRDDDGTLVALLDLRISPELAIDLGDPDLTDLVVGQAWIRIELDSAIHSPVADGTGMSNSASPRGGTLDVSLHTMSGLQEIARDGEFPNGISGMAISTTSCNVGDVNVTWAAPMAEVHPFIIQNVYRLLDGRLEQIGAADVKHGFFATNSNGCGVCQDPGVGSALGPDCSDTYSVSNNSNRQYMAPRHEINPFTGTWDCQGSHFSGGTNDCIRRHRASSLHAPTEHFIQIADGDLGLAGATYYYEGYYIVGGDENKSNNIGWRSASTSWNGSIWIASTLSVFNQGALIDTWGDQRTTVSDGEGQVTLAVTTTDLGNGQYHYEYALFNFDLERQIRSFTLPVSTEVTVSNVGFHDPDLDPGDDWLFMQNAGTITWFTESFAQNPVANTNIYGTLFNFRFDADASPVAATVTLGLFKPGGGTAVAASTMGPPRGVQDCNGNSVDDLDDIAGATSTDCDLNLIPDECDPDCNGNGQPDNCDVFEGTSVDCQPNGVPDECELPIEDCNTNGVIDECDIAEGTSLDCQPNGVPDDCEITAGSSQDANSNGVPDECDPDCNGNGIPDELDVSGGTSTDCNLNVIPDECEPDCNSNGIVDECDITGGTSVDENGNGVPDSCDCRCGDLNRDGAINLTDFATFAGCFGMTVSEATPPCTEHDVECSDFNKDGIIDLSDFATFAGVFGIAPPPPAECFF